MKKTLWLAGLVIIVSLIFGVIYMVAQQQLRATANDPQIQLAEDSASMLNSGASTVLNTASSKVDIASSLAPFIMIFDNNKQLVASSGVLDGSNPVLPPGVLANTTATRENRLTWQPHNGVRIAAVVVKYNNGYVLAGRSLREVERRESTALDQVILGWLATILFIMVWAWLSPLVPHHKHHG